MDARTVHDKLVAEGIGERVLRFRNNTELGLCLSMADVTFSVERSNMGDKDEVYLVTEVGVVPHEYLVYERGIAPALFPVEEDNFADPIVEVPLTKQQLQVIEEILETQAQS